MINEVEILTFRRVDYVVPDARARALVSSFLRLSRENCSRSLGLLLPFDSPGRWISQRYEVYADCYRVVLPWGTLGARRERELDSRRH